MIDIAEKLTLEGNCVLMPNELSRSSKNDYSKEEALMIDQKLDTYQSSYPYRVEIEMQKDLIQNINSLRTIDFVDL